MAVEMEAKRKSRTYGLRDAAFQAAAQGGGENYFSAFALFLHASPLHIGILSALPQLVGVVAQLVSVKILRYFHTPGRLLIGGAWAQGFCWLPILSLPLLLPEHGPWLLGSSFRHVRVNALGVTGARHRNASQERVTGTRCEKNVYRPNQG